MTNRASHIAFFALVLGACGPSSTLPFSFDMSGVADDLAKGKPVDLAVARDLAMSPCGPCTPPRPVCDPKSKQCVACLVDADCPDQSICKANACVPGCSAGHSNCGDAGSCDVDMGQCHGCLSDAECKDAKKPFCDVVSGLCGACDTKNDRCAPGSYCGMQNGGPACIPGCKNDGECQFADGGGASSRCCNHACVDIASSARNCGACGTDCGGGACCTGKCADLTMDPANCGGCGKPCVAPNATPICSGGACSVGPCNMGYADCNQNLKDGCEVNTQSDSANCGACAKVCALPNASPLCLGGICSIGACNQGFKNCNGVTNDGCEVNVGVDPNNCGICGQNCARLPHASAGCANGACAIGSCDAGWGNCNKNDADGCESQLAADPANCGACGKACPAPPNVVTMCTNGVCSTGTCLPGFFDCNNNMADGCEAKVATDAKNCGACGNACPVPANGVAGCNGGQCGIASCNAGFADCDKVPGNGCEININTSASNCGACGTVCNAPMTCQNGVCAGGLKCSDVATAYCQSLGVGWKVSPWANAWPNQPGGSIYCTKSSASADCDTCGTYMQLVWKMGAKDACNSPMVLMPGMAYGGHNPCSCQANNYVCGAWPMQNCTPD